MNKFTILIVIIILTASGFYLYYFMRKSQVSKITINNITYQVKTAQNIADQEKGLGYQKNLDNIDGMLFVYPDKKIRNFWMKGMKFNLDIIWIKDNKIIGIEKNISYVDQVKHYLSNGECNAVLEIVGGRADLDNLKIGDQIKIN